MRRYFAVLGLSMLLLNGAPAHADEAVLKGAMFIKSDKSLFRAVFNQFVERVNETGKGLVRIDPVLGPEAIPAREMPNALTEGVIDVAGLPPAYYRGIMLEADALQLASVSPEEQRKNGAIEYLQSRYNAVGWEFLAQYGYGLQFHLFLDEPIKTLADLKDYPLRTTPTYRHFFDALGARQVETSRGELYTAMERGVVHGYANVMSEVAPAGWDEVTKYRVDPGFYHAIVTITVNKKRWDSLSDEQKAILTSAAEAVESEMAPAMVDADQAEGKKMVDKGMEVITLSDEEGAKLQDMALDAYWSLLEGENAESIGKLRPLLSK
ncbi:MAG: TRAP transporter substrate-binding protein DctP [Alphaproteobacteria bacterium]|nr:TRAP transporter substrate-binding protein DctP [Alphaproteobacteria bacterium]